MTSAKRHLFVYGLLMGGSPNGHGAEERARLGREAALVGPASIRGQLYDLGSYPGLVDSDNGHDLVRGEVYLLEKPAETFIWLDDYEDYFAHDLAGSLYAREMRPVLLSTQEMVEAWVYVYVNTREAARRIVSGRWDARREPQFIAGQQGNAAMKGSWPDDPDSPQTRFDLPARSD